MQKDNKEKLLRMTNDLQEVKVSKSQPFYRHLVIHELDFLYILSQMFTAMSNEKRQKEKDSSVPILDNTKDENSSVNNNENDGSGDSVQQKETMNSNIDKSASPSISTKGGAFSLKTDAESTKVKKKVKKILANTNLSSSAKVELVIDLVLTTRQRAILEAQSKFPSGNQRLLGGGSSAKRHMKPKVVTSSTVQQTKTKSNGIKKKRKEREKEQNNGAKEKQKEGDKSEEGEGNVEKQMEKKGGRGNEEGGAEMEKGNKN